MAPTNDWAPGLQLVLQRIATDALQAGSTVDILACARGGSVRWIRRGATGDAARQGRTSLALLVLYLNLREILISARLAMHVLGNVWFVLVRPGRKLRGMTHSKELRSYEIDAIGMVVGALPHHRHLLRGAVVRSGADEDG